MTATCPVHPDWAPIVGSAEPAPQQYALHVARPDHKPMPGVTPMTSQEWADYAAGRGCDLMVARFPDRPGKPGWLWTVNAEALNVARYDLCPLGQVYGLSRTDKAAWEAALADLGVTGWDEEYAYGLDAPCGVTFMDLNDSWRRVISDRRLLALSAARKTEQAATPLGRAA